MTNLEIPSNNSCGRPLNYCEVLSLILVTLKCMGIITCSWIVPFIPLIIPIVFCGLFLALGVLKAMFSKN